MGKAGSRYGGKIPAARPIRTFLMSRLKPMQIIFIILAVALVALGIFVFGGKNKKSFVEFPSRNLKVEVELAENIVAQAKGLMFRKSLAPNSGMLFVFSDELQRTFWMKNTKIPLDLLFISTDKKIVEIKENFEPCQENSCPTYRSQLSAKYVLEVNAGFVKNNNIQPGEIVNF